MQNESEKRPIFLNLIFERDPSGNYSNDAMLYQNILEYFFETTKNNGTFSHEDGFRFNDLAGWLVMGKNAEFAKDYVDYKSRITKQNRINNRRRRIQQCINNLQEMTLILDKGPVEARRNKHEKTSLYIYSTNAKIIAWIIGRNKTDVLFSKNERVGREKKNELLKYWRQADEEISKLIQSRFSETETSDKKTDLEYKHLSEHIFKSRFFKRCEENKIFHNIVDTIRDILSSSSSKVKYMSDVFDMVVHQYAAFTNKRFREKVWNTFIATLNSLDDTQRKILLYREKFDIERRIKSSELISRQWEELWLQNITDYSKLVLFGCCENCSQCYPVLVDYYKYKADSILLEDTRPVLETDCKKCKAKNKLLISTWDKKKDTLLNAFVA